MKRDSGPKARLRTRECSPSAPTTSLNVRGADRSKVTVTPSAVGQARDGIVEDVLDVIPGGLVQDAHQVTADDLYILRVDDPERAVDAGQPLPGGAHIGHPAGAGARCPGRVQDSRPPGHFDRRPAQVDGLAAVARRGRPLHHDRGEAEPPQPVSQRLPGHAGPRDEHVPVPHRASLVLSAYAEI